MLTCACAVPARLSPASNPATRNCCARRMGVMVGEVVCGHHSGDQNYIRAVRVAADIRCAAACSPPPSVHHVPLPRCPAGCRLPVAGCWLLVAGCRLPVACRWLPVAGCQLQAARLRLVTREGTLVSRHLPHLLRGRRAWKIARIPDEQDAALAPQRGVHRNTAPATTAGEQDRNLRGIASRSTC